MVDDKHLEPKSCLNCFSVDIFSGGVLYCWQHRCFTKTEYLCSGWSWDGVSDIDEKQSCSESIPFLLSRNPRIAIMLPKSALQFADILSVTNENVSG